MTGNAAVIEKCRAIAADLSGVEASDIAADATFLSLGFDSLFLTQLAAAYSRAFKAKVTFRQLIDSAPTINALAEVLPAPVAEEPAPTAPQPVASAPAPTPVPVAPAPVAVPAASAPVANAEGLAGVFQQQLALMQEQIRLLTGNAVAPAASVPAAVGAPASEPESQPAPVAVETKDEPVADEKPALPKGFGPSLVAGAELTSEQQNHLRRLIARHNAKTAGSKAATQDDREVHADPRTAAGFDRRWKDLVYPLVIARSQGAHLWDVDDNRYIDMLNGFGPNFFGHNAPFVREALRTQLDSGFELGPQTPRAGDTARLLCELTGMDRASWVNTGSEAVQAAIRLSRTVTSRNKIVVFEGSYHGNFDEVLVRRTGTGMGRTLPLAPGIPFESVGNVIVLKYGEDESLDLIREHADDIAAVLVEPIQSRRPEFQPKAFVKALRELTRDEGIVLVFDEVITGFRTGPGGAQAYYEIEADLATYGKVLGGGMPIGAVAGRKGVMDTFDGGFWQYGDDSVPSAGVTFFAGTFVRHPLAIAAAHASLSYLKAAGPALQQGINRRAERLQTGMNDLFKERNIPFDYVRFGSQLFLRTGEGGELSPLFFYHMRDRGVHILEGFPTYMTAAHTDEDVEFVIDAARDSLDEMLADEVIPGKIVSPRDLTYTPTPAQTEIWIASQLDPEASLAFNESDTFIFDGADGGRLATAISSVIGEVEAFRTSFDPDGSAARVRSDVSVDLRQLDHAAMTVETAQAERSAFLEREANTPFDLAKGPLVRATLIAERGGRHVLVLYAHHIIFDGWSAERLLDMVAAAYRGQSDDGGVPFSVYAAETAGAGDLAWWAEKFADGVPSLCAWPGSQGSASTETKAATLSATFDAELAGRVRAAAAKMSVSASTLWFAAYGVGLAKVTGQRDLLVGLPAAGQALHDVEAIGCGIYFLPIRMTLEDTVTLERFAKTLQRNIGEAAEHPSVSLGALSREIKARTELGRPPLIQAVFNFRAPFTGVDMQGVSVSANENPRRHLFQELFLNVTEHPGGGAFDAEYRTSMLSEDIVRRVLDETVNTLRHLAVEPECALSTILSSSLNELARPAE